MKNLLLQYKHLINDVLPARYQSPVRFNHCFNRIILDWLFRDCWYHHLDRRKTAISQLNEEQVQTAVNRMNQWLENHALLVNDNRQSLSYRNKHHMK